jgi:enoyl-[acyl-carrier-protein] reductase (NADH)
MASENVEVDADVDDNVFDIDKFVHSLGFKASNQVNDDSYIKQEYTYFKTLLAHEKKVKLIFKI